MNDGGLFDKVSRSFEVEMPSGRTMDEYLDQILPLVKPWSEDLSEMKFLHTRWLEVRDDDHFNDTILHIFQDKGGYMIIKEGDIGKAGWKMTIDSNTIILDTGKGEFFELAFLNSDFFILRKHGNQQKKGMKKYFVLGREAVVARLEWRDMMELMFNLYRGNSKVVGYVAALVVVVAAIIIFSIL